MAAPKPIDLIGSLGVDEESNRMALQNDWLDKGVGYLDGNGTTDIYSDGTHVGTKRPGMAQAGAASAVSGMVYDLKKVRLMHPGGVVGGTTYSPKTGRDVLMGVYRSAAGLQTVGIAYWYPEGSHALVNLGLLGSGGGGLQDDGYTRMIVAGKQIVLLTGRTDGLSSKKAIAVSSPATPTVYGIVDIPNNFVQIIPGVNGPFSGKVGAWHKVHAFFGAASGGSTDEPRGPDVIFSPFNDPAGQFNSQDSFTVDPTGLEWLGGMISAGEVLFMGKPVGIWRLTGSLNRSFRVERIASPYGFMGMRSMDVLAPGVIAGFVTESEFASGIALENPIPANVALISSEGAKAIGERVLTSIRVNADVMTQARVRAWPSLRGMLMIPDIQEVTSASTSALFMSTDTQGFWKWSISAAMMPDSLEYSERTMYAGCGDGLIRRFLASSATDGAASFVPTVLFPPFNLGRKTCIDRVQIHASQSSGSTWSVDKATDFGSFGTAKTFTPGTSPTASIPITFTGNTGTGYVQQLRVKMSSSGVGSKFYRARVYFKDIGGK